MKTLTLGALLGLISLNAAATDVTLRTAIYRYNQPIYANSMVELRGTSCDILQLVLDVTSGYTDLKILNGGMVRYPDRVLAAHDVFAYSLYSSSHEKGFNFHSYDPDLPAESNPDSQVGTATIFGYCFTSAAYPANDIDIYLDDTKNRVRYFDDGTSQSY